MRINSNFGLVNRNISDFHTSWDSTLVAGEDWWKIAICSAFNSFCVTDSQTHTQTDCIICPMLLMHWTHKKVISRWNKLDQPTVDAPSVSAFKTGLSKIRDKRVGFFVD